MKNKINILYFSFLAIGFIFCSCSHSEISKIEEAFLVDINSNNLDTLITNSKQPVIVRYTNNSDYCKKADLKFIKQAKKYKNTNKFVRFNIDSQVVLSKTNKIDCIPLTKIYYQGKFIEEYIGVLAKFEFDFLFRKLNKTINKKDKLVSSM